VKEKRYDIRFGSSTTLELLRAIDAVREGGGEGFSLLAVLCFSASCYVSAFPRPLAIGRSEQKCSQRARAPTEDPKIYGTYCRSSSARS